MAFGKNNYALLKIFSSGTDEDRAKRDPSLCNESVNGHFLSNLCLNCIFKWTWFVKTDIWSVIDRSRVRFPVAATLIFFSFSPIFPLFWLGSPSVPLEFPKLANAQPSNFGPLCILYFKLLKSAFMLPLLLSNQLLKMRGKFKNRDFHSWPNFFRA